MKHKKMFTILFIVFIPMIIYTVLILRNGLDNFFTQLLSLNKKWILLSCLFMLLNWLFESHVLNIMVKFFHERQLYIKSFQTTMIGQFFNSITPFATGGQPMQLYYLVQSEGMSTGCATSILLLKFVIYQTVLTLYSLIVLIIKFNYFSQRINHLILFAVMGFLLNSSIIIMCILFSKNKILAHKIIIFTINTLKKIKILRNTKELLLKSEEEIENFYNGILMLKTNTKLWIPTAVLTILQLTSFYLISYCINKSFRLSGNLFDIVSAQAFVQMIMSIIPSPGASGAAEGSFYIFFQLFFSSETIAPAIVLWRIITYYSCLVIGALVMAMPTVLLTIKILCNKAKGENTK